MLGGVGDAGAEIVALLNNRHRDRSLSVAQQMRGEENAARAAADDKHAPHLKSGPRLERTGPQSAANFPTFERALIWWDQHRHRIAPDAAAKLEAASARGQLRIVAGRALAFEPRGRGVDVLVVHSKSGTQERLPAEAVFECRGRATDVRRTEIQAARSWRTWGGVRAGIEWAVARNFRVGVAGNSRIWMHEFENYRGLFAEQGTSTSPRVCRRASPSMRPRTSRSSPTTSTSGTARSRRSRTRPPT